ncbi:MAG: PAS domain-containing protein [Leptolyngbyaceae cyanobacterium bins.59]|nr:PAS domain-containing protein [Leptolyngbyaceae cyanobacterium bins.59]
MNDCATSFPVSPRPRESGTVLQLADGTIQACNTTAQRILGVTLAQLREWNRVLPPWQTIHADGSPFPSETHPTTIALQTGQCCTDVVMGLYQPNGELIWLLINTEPLLEENS